MPAVTEELLKWSATLKSWQRDALRRLAAADVLTPEEEDEVLHILKAEHGINCEADLPEPVPLVAEHLPAGKVSVDVRLKAIANVHNVNQLVDSCRLDFAPNGLTTIYGDNGAGKSGFIRILRNACRSRIWSANGKTAPILPNIYGSAANGPATADIHVVIDRGDRILTWRDSEPPPSDLAHIAVFDSQAAALYIDESNHIAFLPYNLDLFFKLNRLCLSLKTRLEKDQRDLKALLTPLLCQIDPTTEAGQFLAKLSAKTTREDVEEASRWTDQDKARSESWSDSSTTQHQQRPIWPHWRCGWKRS